MSTKAKELQRGDIFRLHVFGQVLAVVPVAGGKRIKVKISLEDQGQRVNAEPSVGSLLAAAWNSPTKITFWNSSVGRVDRSILFATGMTTTATSSSRLIRRIAAKGSWFNSAAQ